MTKSRRIYEHGKPPTPEKDLHTKKYIKVNPCPMCDNSDSDTLTKLHSNFYQCEKCGCEYDYDTGLIRNK